MKRGSILFALAVALPGVAFAATTATKAPAKSATPLQLQPGAHQATLSPEGSATAQRIFGTPDPRGAQIQAELLAIRQDQQKLAATQPIDLGKLAVILQRGEAIKAEVAKLQDDKVLELFKALSEPDRVALLQQMLNPPQLQNSRTAPQASRPAVPPVGAAPPPAVGR